MNILVINGPNLNLLGQREPVIYGVETYDALCRRMADDAVAHGDSVNFLQSNHEGVLIDTIQQAQGRYDGIVINPGAYAHYSYALHDALRAVTVPAVEVHISDIAAREDWRHISVTAPACVAMVTGEGTDGYLHAMALLRRHGSGGANL